MIHRERIAVHLETSTMRDQVGRLIIGEGDPKERRRGDLENTPIKKTCDVCGKDAIGIQILGCCASTVCEEHAEYQLHGLKPGEKKEWGVCYFYRFPDDLEE